MSRGPVSIVVEWDNVRLSKMDRCREMLRRLQSQSEALDRPVEVVVACNQDAVEAGRVSAVLCEHLRLPWRLLDARGADYYELKNRASAECRGDVVVFIDSDVVPEPGWLAALLAVLDDPGVAVACGVTFIDPTNLYSRAFGLFWFFPVRSSVPKIDKVETFFANNVAFRRETFLRYPYPATDGWSRGACKQLAKTLQQSGIAIWQNSAAQVAHPAPNGLSHFVVRALAQGRDTFLQSRLRSGWSASPAGCLGRLGWNLARSGKRTVTLYARVGLRAWQIPAAAGIAGAYYLILFAGDLATFVARGWMVRRFRI